MKNRKAKKGFTIIELVVVIAVIGILAAVLIPTFSGVIDKANASAAAQNAKVIYEEASVAAAMGNVSLEGMYISDNAGKYIYKVVGGSLEIQDAVASGLTATEVKSNMKIYMSGVNVTFNNKQITFANVTGTIVIRNMDGEECGAKDTNSNHYTIVTNKTSDNGWYSFTVKGTDGKVTNSGVFYLA